MGDKQKFFFEERETGASIYFPVFHLRSEAATTFFLPGNRSQLNKKLLFPFLFFFSLFFFPFFPMVYTNKFFKKMPPFS